MDERKYEINREKLEEFYEDLFVLEDWIPTLIKMYLPIEINMKRLSGDKVKNKKLRGKRIMKHQRELGPEGYYEYINWEVETFLRKYPYFKPLFIKI